MRIATVQFCPVLRNVEANLTKIIDDIHAIDADVIVFPELATSGYLFLSTEEALPYSLTIGGDGIARVVEAATSAGKVVITGFCERDGDVLYNSALICGNGIEPQVYRKTHLFYKEAEVFAPGNTGFNVFELPHLDCTLGIMICYDWRFPESSRTLALKGADVIVAPSNLITHIWKMAMPVRALENKVYLAVANRTGSETNLDESVIFNGCSTIYAYNGSVLAEADATSDAIVIATIDPVETRSKQFNSVNELFRDRRPDLYF